MKFLKKYYYVFSGLTAFIIYLTTLAPTVVKIDSGELAAVQLTLGIAHPTGYPLFTVVGYLFSLIPLPFSEIYLMNILSAVWCSAAVSVFVYTSKYVLDNINSFTSEKKKQKKVRKKKKVKDTRTSSSIISIPENKKLFASIAGGLILAFSRTFWMQSTSVEVYSLHIFLISSAILFLIKGFTEEISAAKISKNWILFSVFLAFGLSNHMTTILVLPGAAYLFFSKYKINKASFKKIGLMFLIFLPVLILIYSYLPVRASQNPQLNWGNPVDLERIIRHISGRQYQVWLFSSAEAARKQLTYFFNSLPVEFTINLFFAFIGLIYSLVSVRRFGVFILILFIGTVLYSINYDINDIDSYFLLAFISAGFFSVLGVVKLFSILKIRNSYSISALLTGLFILTHLIITYSKVDESDTYIYEDYTRGLLGNVSENAVILSYQWDYFISASYYLQLAEDYRRDVAVIDKELLRRSWYYNQIERNHPEILKDIKTETGLFLEALKPFERDENFNPALLESLFRRIMTNLVSTNIDKRDVYIGPELFENEMQKGEFVLPEGFSLVPDLFLFKVVRSKDYVPVSEPDFRIRIPGRSDKYTENIINLFICPMLVRRALYELKFDKLDRARLFLQKIQQDFPGYNIPGDLKKAVGM